MEQGERLDSTLMPQGQDVEHSTDGNEALDAAATRLLTAPSQPLSVAAAIEGHRAAREALNAACPAQDEVALAAAGRDTSDEAMAPARAAWKAADEREEEAFEALLSCRPTDPAGLAQMLAYIAESPALGDLDDSTDALRSIAAAAEGVARSVPSGNDTELLSLGRQFDAENATWLALVAAVARGKRAGSAEEEAMNQLGFTSDKIMAIPAHSLRGLAVKARSAIPAVWSFGNFEADAGPDEDWTPKNVRDLINACLSLAGVDWKGNAIGLADHAPASAASGATLIEVDPTISGMAAELWQASISLRQAEDDLMAERIPEEEWEPYHEAVIGLIDKLSEAPAKSIQDMAYKSLALTVMESWEVSFNDDPADDNRRRRIGRQFDERVVSEMSPRVDIRVRPAARLDRSGAQRSAASRGHERPPTIPSAPTASSFIQAQLVEMNGIADEWWGIHDAAGRAADAAETASDQTAEGMAELASTRAIRILRENLLRANNLPATTVGEIGLQARLIAVELNDWWSSQSLSQGEKACRTLLDRLMGLAGVSPIDRGDVTPAEVRDWIVNPIPHAARIIPDMPEARS